MTGQEVFLTLISALLGLVCVALIWLCERWRNLAMDWKARSNEWRDLSVTLQNRLSAGSLNSGFQNIAMEHSNSLNAGLAPTKGDSHAEA